MNSLWYNSDLTAALLSIAVVISALSFAAIAFFMWKRIPVSKKDDYQRNKVHDRLMELASSSHAPRKSA